MAPTTPSHLTHDELGTPSQLRADCAAVGLAVESRFSSYDVRPFTDASDYAVHVLRHAV